MLYPSAWFDRQRVLRALRGYAVYSPPFPGVPGALSREEGLENFEHFMRVKTERLEGFRAFLAGFGADASLSCSGLRSVDAWCHRFAGHLIPKQTVGAGLAFAYFVPSFRGPYLVLNVVLDLGIWAGEMTHQLNPACKWFFHDGWGEKDAYEFPDYYRPCISTQRKPGYWDVFSAVYHLAQTKRRTLQMGQPPFPRNFEDYAPNALESRIAFRSSRS
jgi:hypothetical protein